MLSGPAAISANIETLIERCGAGSGDKVRQSPFFYKPLFRECGVAISWIHSPRSAGGLVSCDLMGHSRTS